MDELIDILDSSGNFTGESCLKSVAHKKGLYHATIHVWFYTKNKQVLLQKRASTKKVFPNLWDVSVAGHISAGESIIGSAIREVREEIGLEISENQLNKVGIRLNKIQHPNGILDCEFKHIYVCELTKPISKLRRQISEVDDIKLFDLSILKDSTKHGNFMVKNIDTYYDFIFEKISNLFN